MDNKLHIEHVLFADEAYRLDIGTIYYVADPLNVALNDFVLVNRSKLVRGLNKRSDIWFRCEIKIIDAGNTNYIQFEPGLYGAVVSTVKDWSKGYPFIHVSLKNCNVSLIEETLECFAIEIAHAIERNVDSISDRLSIKKLEKGERYIFSAIKRLNSEYARINRQLQLMQEYYPASNWEWKMLNAFCESHKQNRLRFSLAKESKVVIDNDYNIYLPLYNIKIEMSPFPKSLYFLILRHPKGIRRDRLIDYRDEWDSIYIELSKYEKEDYRCSFIGELFVYDSNGEKKQKEKKITDALSNIEKSIRASLGQDLMLQIGEKYLVQSEKIDKTTLYKIPLFPGNVSWCRFISEIKKSSSTKSFRY